MEAMDSDESGLNSHTIQVRFVSDQGEEAGPPIDLPVAVDVKQLGLIVNALLKKVVIYKYFHWSKDNIYYAYYLFRMTQLLIYFS